MSGPPSSSSGSRERIPDLDFRLAQEEFAELSGKFVHLQDRLVQAMRSSEEAQQRLGARVAALESQTYEDRAQILRLQSENAELRKRTTDPRSNLEVQKVVGERDAALHKLRHVRRVLRDLLDEKKMGNDAQEETLAPHAGSESIQITDDDRYPAALSNAEGQLSTHAFVDDHDRGSEADTEALQIHETRESTPEPSGKRMGKKKDTATKPPLLQEDSFVIVDSPKVQDKSVESDSDESTVRAGGPNESGRSSLVATSSQTGNIKNEQSRGRTNIRELSREASHTASTRQSRPTIVSKHVPGTSARTSPRGDNRVPSVKSDSMSRPSQPPTYESAISSRNVEEEVHAAAGDITKWFVQYTRPPGSAQMVEGPFFDRDLSGNLGLNEETIVALRRLSRVNEHHLRVFIEGKMAFLYDPMTLESPASSYLIDWGLKDTNDEIKEYITGALEQSPVFHTFLYPIKKNGWYYIGAHSWRLVKVWSVWKTLTDKAKHALAVKLKKRWEDGPQVVEIAEMIGDGRLEQFCVEISSKRDLNSSQAFAAQLRERMRA